MLTLAYSCTLVIIVAEEPFFSYIDENNDDMHVELIVNSMERRLASYCNAGEAERRGHEYASLAQTKNCHRMWFRTATRINITIHPAADTIQSYRVKKKIPFKTKYQNY